MKKLLLPLLIALPIILRAQILTKISIHPVPHRFHKIQGSLYDKIEFLDSRTDTTIGTVFAGITGTKPKMILMKLPVEPQFIALMQSMLGEGAKGGTLLFQLRDFGFIEPAGTRFCHLHAAVYALQPGGFQKVRVLDTTFLLTLDDVVPELDRVTNRIIPGFLASTLTLQPSDSTLYSREDLRNYDSLEKMNIPLYTASTFKEGMYSDYASFSQQTPNAQGTVEVNQHGAITKVKADLKYLYALVYHGTPYIATSFGFYRLRKFRNDFYFKGDIHVRGGTNSLLPGPLGLINGMILGTAELAGEAAGSRETYELLLDYQNGGYIHLDHIPTGRTDHE